MKSVKLLLVGCLAVCALGVSFVSSASAALPAVLPETAGKTFTGAGKETVFETEGGKKVTCTAATAEGNEKTGVPLGEFHIKFTGCTTTVAGIKFACTGLGDEKEIILVLGEWHIVPPSDLLLFLITNVHFECAGGFALVKVSGSVACPIKEASSKKVTHEFNCEQEKGKAKATEYENDKGEKVKAALKYAENEGTETGSAELALGSTVTYTEAVEIMG